MARIKVFGVGSCGRNILNYIIKTGLRDAEFAHADTNSASFGADTRSARVLLGKRSTRSKAELNPAMGRVAANQSMNALRKQVAGCDIVFICAGMGGGTGTGAAPVIARAAEQSGALIIGFVTTPFDFEGNRKNLAKGGIDALLQYVDGLFCVSNNKLLTMAPPKSTFQEIMECGNKIGYSVLTMTSDLLRKPRWTQNFPRDFIEIANVLQCGGLAMIGGDWAEADGRQPIDRRGITLYL